MQIFHFSLILDNFLITEGISGTIKNLPFSSGEMVYVAIGQGYNWNILFLGWLTFGLGKKKDDGTYVFDDY